MIYFVRQVRESAGCVRTMNVRDGMKAIIRNNEKTDENMNELASFLSWIFDAFTQCQWHDELISVLYLIPFHYSETG